MSLARFRTLSLRPLAVGVALAAASMLAQAQNLQQLYEAARGYDATYLAVLAQTEAAQSRLAQSGALRLPVATLGASATRSGNDAPDITLPDGSVNPARVYGNVNQAAINARQPLYNKANEETISHLCSHQLSFCVFARGF